MIHWRYEYNRDGWFKLVCLAFSFKSRENHLGSWSGTSITNIFLTRFWKWWIRYWPSLVALTKIDKWVAGIVTNNVWTFGDIGENKFLFQYFINYNLPKAWYLVSATIMTANWNAASDQRWIVPFGGGLGKVFKIGKLNAHMYYNAVKPDMVGNWQSRVQQQFLFPKK